MTPGQPVTLDAGASGFPIRSLNDVPAGDYFVQAVLHRYETFRRADGHTLKLPMDRGEGQHWNLAPGNCTRHRGRYRSALPATPWRSRWTRRSRRSLNRRTRSTSAT